jgi:hypothetical protein
LILLSKMGRIRSRESIRICLRDTRKKSVNTLSQPKANDISGRSMTWDL